MQSEKIKQFLDEQGIDYICIAHSPTYTAQTTAQSSHVSGRILAKAVIVDLDGQIAMAVLPANQRVILEDLRELTGCQQVKLVSEGVFKKKFPDCETGAMPPFGNPYGMDVYAAGALSQNDEIAFKAGSHSEIILMAYKDFERLAHPKILQFTA